MASGRHLIKLIVAFLAFFSVQDLAKAQSYELFIEPQVNNDTLYLGVFVYNISYIDATTSGLPFGASNFTIDLPDTSAVDFANAFIADTGLWRPSNSNGFNAMSLSPITFSVPPLNPRLRLNINQNFANYNPVSLAVGDTGLIARIGMEITDCSQDFAAFWHDTAASSFGDIADYGGVPDFGTDPPVSILSEADTINPPSITLNSLVTATPAATEDTICLGDDPAVINGGTVSGGDGVNYTFKWRITNDTTNPASWADLTAFAAANANYDPVAGDFIADGIYYFQRIAQSNGCYDTSFTDSIVVVPTITDGGTIEVNTTDDTLCYNGSATGAINSTAAAVASSGTIEYLWQDSTATASGMWADLGTWTTTPTYDLTSYPSAFDTTKYFRRIARVQGTTCPDTSNVDSVVVLPQIDGGTIALDPADDTLCNGGAMSLGLLNSTSSTAGSFTIEYKWQDSTSSSGSWTDVTDPEGTFNTAYNSYLPSGTFTDTTFFRRVARIQGTNCEDFSNVDSVIVQPPFGSAGLITVNPSEDTLCSGSTPTSALAVTVASAGSATIEYKWQDSTGTSTVWADVAGAAGIFATGNTGYTPTGPVDETTWYRRIAQIQGTSCQDTSNVDSIVVPPAIDPGAILVDAAVDTLCNGSTIATGIIDGSAVTIGSFPISYQWQDSTASSGVWGNLAGATGEDYDLSTYPSTFDSTVFFRRVVSISNIGCDTIGPADTIEVAPAFTSAGTITATSDTICYNSVPDTVEGTAATLSYGGWSVTYQWQDSTTATGVWQNIAGADSIAYVPTTAYTDTTYLRRLAIVEGTACDTFSNTDTIIVTPGISNPGSITLDPIDDTLCYGGTMSIGITNVDTANTTSGGSPVEYKWQATLDTTTSWTDSTTWTVGDSTYLPTGSFTQTTYFRRIARVQGTTCPDTSNVDSVVVLPQIDGGTIALDPADDTLCNGGAMSLGLLNSTSSTAGSFTIEYKWQDSTSSSGSWTDVTDPEGTFNTAYNSYLPSGTFTDTTFFRRVARIQGTNCEDFSNVDSVIVQPPFGSAGLITVNPSEDTLCSGSTPTSALAVTVASAGSATIEYKWQDSTGTSTVWADVAGAAGIFATGNTGYTPTGPVDETTWYRRIAQIQGTSCQDTSNVDSIVVPPAIDPGAILVDAAVDTLCNGSTIATGIIDGSAVTIGSFPISYQWQDSTASSGVWGNLAGATGEDYDLSTYPSTFDSTVFFRRVVSISNIGCDTIGPADTIEVAPAFTSAGTITATSDTICYNSVPDTVEGTAATLSYGGWSVTYQWQDSTTATGVWQNIAGADSIAYVPTTAYTDTTYLRRLAIVEGTACDTFSNTDTIIVTPGISNPGSITLDPIDDTLCYGGTMSIGITNVDTANTTSGGSPVEYKWQATLDTTTSWTDSTTWTVGDSTYLPTGSFTQTTYFRRIARVQGTTCPDTSNVDSVVVLPQIDGGTIALDPADDTLCNGGAMSLGLLNSTSSTAGSFTIEYKWQDSTSSSGSWTDVTDPEGTFNTAYNSYLPSGTFTDTTFFRRVARIQGTNCEDFSNVDSVIVQPPFGSAGLITVNPSEDTLCSGSTPTSALAVTVASAGSATIEYKWQDSTGTSTVWADVAGAAGIFATGNTGYTPTGPVDETTWYRRIAQIQGTSCQDTSNVDSIVVPPAIDPGAILVDAAVDTLCNGSTIATGIIDGSAVTIGSFPISYQWQDSTASSGVWGNLAGATGEDYDLSTYPSTFDSTVFFRRVVSISNIGCDTIGPADTIEVAPAFTSAGTITATSDTICYNSVPDTVEGTAATLSYGGWSVTYQWQDSTTATGVWQNIAGADSIAYVPTTAYTDTTYLRRLAIVEGTACDTFSNTDTIIVTPGISNPGSITLDPIDDTLCYGGTMSIGITNVDTANTTSGGSPVEYKWQATLDTTTSWTDSTTWTVGDSTYLPTGSFTQTTYFRRIARVQGTTCPDTSNVDSVVVLPQIDGGTIALDPADDTLCNGGAMSLGLLNSTSSTAGSFTIEYKWQDSTSSSGSWTDVTDPEGTFNTAYNSYLPSGTFTDTTFFRRVARIQGTNCEDFSNVDSVIVQPPFGSAGLITVNPSEDTLCSGSTPTSALAVTVASAGSATIEYKWQDSTGTSTVWADVAGAAGIFATGNTGYTPTGPVDETTWYRRIAQIQGTSCQDTSNVDSIVVPPAIDPGAILVDAAVDTLCNGSTIATGIIDGSAVTIGSFPISYQWQDSTASSGVWGNLAGATGEDYDLSTYPSTFDSTVFFRRVVSISNIGCDTIGPADTIEVAPAITAAGTVTVSDDTVFAGTTPGAVNGTVETLSYGGWTTSYQWQLDSTGTWTTIAGATAANYSPGALADTTAFRRIVTIDGTSCADTSNVDTTIVIPQLVDIQHLVLFGGSETLCYNEVASGVLLDTIDVFNGTDSVEYQFEVSNDTTGTWTVEQAFSTTDSTFGLSQLGQLTDTTYIRMRYRTKGSSFEDSTTTFTLILAPEITDPGTFSLSDDTICEGDAVNITATASSIADGSTPQYVWESYVDTSGFLIDTNGTLLSNTFNQPATVNSVDLDLDGDEDLVVNSLNDDKLAWYENDGTGSYSTEQVISTATDGAFNSQIADINGDGLPDIVVSSVFANKVAWFQNVGSGTFSTLNLIDNPAPTPRNLSTGDLDGDGDQDVLISLFTSGQVGWYANDGNGGFGSLQVLPFSFPQVEDVSAADIDGDGDQDLLSASSADNRIAWYENDGSGNFTLGQDVNTNALVAQSVVAADFDNDGDLDLLSTSANDDKVAWYENTGGGNFGAEQIISTNADFVNFAGAADIDGDGDMDAFSASNNDNKIAWYANDGAGNFSTEIIISTSTIGADFATPTDADGDGDLDIVGLGGTDNTMRLFANNWSSTGSISQNLGTVSPSETTIYRRRTFVPGTSCSAVTAEDTVFVFPQPVDVQNLALSGGSETLCYNEVASGVLLDTIDVFNGTDSVEYQFEVSNDTTGTWTVEQAFSTTDSTFGLSQLGQLTDTTYIRMRYRTKGSTCEDSTTTFTLIVAPEITDPGTLSLSNDTICEGESVNVTATAATVASGTVNYEWEQFFPDSNLFDTTGMVTSTGSQPTDIFVEDVDNDGDLDYYSNNFSGTDITLETFAAGSYTSSVVASSLSGAFKFDGGDIDGDGDIDLAVGLRGTDELVVLENTGALPYSFTSITAYTLNSPTSVELVDIDSDGDLDILASNSAPSNTTAWYENDGSGNFTTEHIVLTGLLTNYFSKAADMDGDGDMDIVITAQNSDRITVAYNDGNQNFGTVLDLPGWNTDAYALDLADLNGDGFMDVIASNLGTDEVVAFINLGTPGSWDRRSLATLTPATSSFVVKAVDFDHDGDMDVIASHNANGQLIGWYNDGTGNFGAQTILTTATINAYAIESGDYDGDGFDDLFVADRADNEIVVHQNNWSKTGTTSQNLGTVSPTENTIYRRRVITDGFSCSAVTNQDTVVVIPNPANVQNLTLSNGNDTLCYNEVPMGTLLDTMVLFNGVDSVEYQFESAIDSMGAWTVEQVWSTDSTFGLSQLGQLTDTTYLRMRLRTQGSSCEDTSNAFTLIVAPEITDPGTLSLSNDTICEGESVNVTATAATVASGTVSYEWESFVDTTGESFIQFPRDTVLLGTPSATYATTSDIDGDGDLDVISTDNSNNTVIWQENDGAGNFGAPITITSNALGASKVLAEDLDGDGDDDIISISASDNTLSWFENTGGTFGAENIISDSVTGIINAAIGDLDKDGDLDFAVVATGSNEIFWYEWISAGVYQEHFVSSAVNNPTGIAIGDLNNDGLQDIVSASTGDDKLAWYPNLGNGSFGAQVVLTTIQDFITYIDLADFNGDGNLDIASISQFDDDVVVHLLDGSGTITSDIVVNNSEGDVGHIDAADFDNDGWVDLVSPSAWYRNTGSAVFDPAYPLPTGGLAEATHAADLTGDGFMELILVSSGNIYYNSNKLLSLGVTSQDLGSVSPTENTIYRRRVITDGFSCSAVTNQDTVVVIPNPANVQNLTLSNGSDTLCYNEVPMGMLLDTMVLFNGVDSVEYQFESAIDSMGAWTVEQVWSTDSTFGLSQLGQLTDTTYLRMRLRTQGSSCEDTSNAFTLIVAPEITDPGTLSLSNDTICEGESVNVTATAATVASGTVSYEWESWVDTSGFMIDTNGTLVSTNFDQPVSVNSVDVEGDGDEDLVVVSLNDNKLSWFENDGSGAYLPEQVIYTSGGDLPINSHIADINGDGLPDIVLGSISNNHVAWFENAGGGAFSGINLISNAAGGMRSVNAADIDGDGDQDVLAAIFGSNEVAWFENDGSGSFGPKLSLPFSFPFAEDVFPADLDGDGDMDLITASGGDDRISWYENDGSGNFTFGQDLNTSALNAQSVVAADLDGDGDLDVVSGSAGDDKIAWYENDGSGTFLAEDIISLNAVQVNNVRVDDIDGDGDLDVYSASNGDNKFAWYANDGTGNFGSEIIISTSAVSAEYLTATDADGDGDLDIAGVSGNDDALRLFTNNWSKTGSTAQDLGIVTPTENTIYRRRVTVDGFSCSAVTNQDTVVVIPTPMPGTIALDPADDTLCYGGTMTVGITNVDTAFTSTGLPIEYKWQATLDTTTTWTDSTTWTVGDSTYLPTGTFTQTTYFQRLARVQGSTCGDTSNIVWVEVAPQIDPDTIAVDLASDTLCYLSASTDTIDGAPVTYAGFTIEYQWQDSTATTGAWNNAPGDSASEDYDLSFYGTFDTTTYFRRIVRIAGLGCDTVSNIDTIEVTPPFDSAGTIMPLQDTVCYGEIPDTVQATDASIPGSWSLAYQWQDSTASSLSWNPIAGADSVVYVPTAPLPDTTYFRRIATIEGTGCTDTSTVDTIVVLPGITTAGTIGFGNPGQADTVCFSSTPMDSLTFTTLPSSSNAGPIEYIWEYSQDSGSNWTDAKGSGFLVDDTTLTFGSFVGVLDTTTWFRSRYRGQGSLCEDTSNYDTLVVAPAFVGTDTIQALSDTICYNTVPDTLSGPVTSLGEPGWNVTYQWQDSTASSLSWNPIAGADSVVYIPTAPLPDTTYFRRIATIEGTGCTDTSTVDTIVVLPGITTAGTIGFGNPGQADTVCFSSTPMDSLTFTTLPSSSNAGPIEYIWEYSQDSGSNWTDAKGSGFLVDDTTLTFGSFVGVLDTTTWFRSRYRGQGSLCEDTSNYDTLVVAPAFVGTDTIQALSDTICYNTVPDTLSGPVTSLGEPGWNVTYQWQDSTASSLSWNPIAGADSVVYVPTAPLTDTTYFRRIATIEGTGCTDTSTVDTIVVLPGITTAGTIDVADAEDSLCAGDTLPNIVNNLSPAVSPLGALEYQWQDSTASNGWEAITAWGVGLTLDYDSIVTENVYLRRAVRIAGYDGCVQYSNLDSIMVQPGLKADFRIWLQGPYDAGIGAMTTGIASTLLKDFEAGGAASPDPVIGEMNPGYIVPATASDSAVDVIKIVFRTDPLLQSSEIDSVYAWLMSDGSIRDFATGTLPYVDFCQSGLLDSTTNYWAVVRHRNHVQIMSANSLQLTAGTPTPVDLSDIANIYSIGAVPVDNTPVRYALPTGDNEKDATHQSNALDFYNVAVENASMTPGYIPEDLDMSGGVNATDFNKSSRANDFLYFSTVP